LRSRGGRAVIAGEIRSNKQVMHAARVLVPAAGGGKAP
jgi:hypothetical protein